MVDAALLALLAGLFGLLVGSFLNVCIVRLPAEQSVITPRSRCPKCGTPVAWHDNIPVLSWLVLTGKCRSCRAPISIMYPLVELSVGLLWVFALLHYGVNLAALKAALFGTLLFGIALTDAREYLIPNEFTWGGLILGLVLSAAGGLHSVLLALLGAAVGFAILWLVGTIGKWIFKEEAMGGGDIKMMAMVGSFVGWQGVLLTIFLGALAGTAIFLPLAVIGKKKLVPFGVFLALGAAVTYLVGPSLILWYRRYLGVG
ncbi:MAG TPA: prepilin peptidase [Gemmatimonadales bacterium]|jgi:leader peptidase (prepilin peptidase)/N-methyltransferase|nr:prepilin peptidase [Gemmatimonadales bacterium]